MKNSLNLQKDYFLNLYYLFQHLYYYFLTQNQLNENLNLVSKLAILILRIIQK